MSARRLVTLAVPCRTDEPALPRTLALALASWRAAPQAATSDLEILVCLNGSPVPALTAALGAFARGQGAPFVVVDMEAPSAPVPSPTTPLALTVLATRREGKAIAWNLLRTHAHGALAVFVDADVSIDGAAIGRLLGALESAPAVTLASGKTTCRARPGTFEEIMAAPYGVDFPNLSPQLYGARVAELPAHMPEDLIEPERWLELELGRERMVRLPEVRVQVRLPGTLRDFFRQRVRIEMGKVQLAHAYPGLDARGARQPARVRALLGLGPRAGSRLAVYVGLRAVAHAIAWGRYRAGATAGVWRRAHSTKDWDDA